MNLERNAIGTEARQLIAELLLALVELRDVLEIADDGEARALDVGRMIDELVEAVACWKKAGADRFVIDASAPDDARVGGLEIFVDVVELSLDLLLFGVVLLEHDVEI